MMLESATYSGTTPRVACRYLLFRDRAGSLSEVTMPDLPGWSIHYADGARLATICLDGRAVDCRQMPDWDWETSRPVSEVTADDLAYALWDYVMVEGSDE